MPFPFSAFTELLQKLEDIERRDPPTLPVPKAKDLKAETEIWFKKHRYQINGLDVPGAVALLSSLLPERRTDRVYGIQAPSLCRILGRELGLRSIRLNDLQAYKRAGAGDLAQCLERVIKTGGPPARPPVMLEEADEMLLRLAGQCRFSDGSVRAKLPSGSPKERDKLIGDVVKRLHGQEAKWFVRLILKNFAPVRINETQVLKLFHFLLPDLLRFQNNLEVAVRLLKEQPHLKQLPEQPDSRSEKLFKQGAASALTPLVGVKIGRPDFFKARSIDHCLTMVASRKYVLERKYDGEYCEVHVDLRRSERPVECIQIFSKSGKDSTTDRQGLHDTLVDCLRLGRHDCKIRKQAILLGELVVYSEETKTVLPFDKIRNYVSRSGTFFGNSADLPQSAHEHLAIFFFDLLLLDDEVIMTKPVEERRKWLREVYRKIPGRAMGAEWKVVDFADSQSAKRRLLEQFAASIAERCEGLVLKPCGLPYFPLDSDMNGHTAKYTKLKKDYIATLGDEADFAVVGASYNAQQALKSGVTGIKWTDFHLGCLTNATEVQRFGANPVFRIVYTIQQDARIPKPILQALNTFGIHQAFPYSSGKDGPTPFTVQTSVPTKIDVLFRTPFVLEILGSGFDKPLNCNFYMLRHARATKLHQDRSWKDCVSFQALQEQADAARKAPVDGGLDETRCWLEKIERRLRRRLEKEGSLTPSSRRTKTPGIAETTTTSVASALHGTTLVEIDSCNEKRAPANDADTPCPPTKRQRSHASDELQQRSTVSLNALSDITNQVTYRNSTTRIEQSRSAKEPFDKRIPVRDTIDSRCCGTECPFNKATVHLAPCVRSSPYLIEDLLPMHGAEVIHLISHWDRDSFAHPSLTETVSESQSHAGLRKIVIVEAKRPQAVNKLIKQLSALNGGRLKERIEVYDWRVLEECAQHDQGPEALKQHFIGATIWDEARQRAIFVSTIPGIGPR